MQAANKLPPATVEDFLARPDGEHIELIRGAIVEKAAPSAEHSAAQAATTSRLAERFQRRPGGRAPGGWWFFTELDVRLGAEIFRPDLCAYRRERMPEPVRGRPVDLTPDWVCELLSSSNADRDRVEKLQSYFRAGVPHYWLLDPVEGTLEVLRRTDLAYALVLVAHRGQKVRAEPFEAVELRVDELFGADPEDDG